MSLPIMYYVVYCVVYILRILDQHRELGGYKRSRPGTVHVVYRLSHVFAVFPCDSGSEQLY